MFSLYGKLLKMCPKMAAEVPFGAAKPRWSPQRQNTNRIELKVFVNLDHLSRPFF